MIAPRPWPALLRLDRGLHVGETLLEPPLLLDGLVALAPDQPVVEAVDQGTQQPLETAPITAPMLYATGGDPPASAINPAAAVVSPPSSASIRFGSDFGRDAFAVWVDELTSSRQNDTKAD
ncbi:hypothetical protein FHP25_08520 [Vineibacter terrae]|uniref:Uncharacterized protein n=1 Tax=Vineibacter terrae TaxID=2586908 RepID=A0A5C8PRP0_9HYPH|nr:hypothetical protein [Vineibacter terrae]TXL78230.1 hypothetical protein FHP25_08520 [Vineibacter terrae]